jgi:ComF family protein
LRLPEARKICHKDFPYLLGAATEYRGVTKKLIHALKFNFTKDAVQELGMILLRYVERVGWQPSPETVVLPIPLSKRRERERGFNQAALLSEIFADKLNLRLEKSALKRVRHTLAQSKTASPEERARNIQNCFTVDPAYVRSKNIILIDDVVTSGATLSEAARSLKNSGVKNILALVVAKA